MRDQHKDLICPRCGGREFIEHECGPDTYEDDVAWISYTCKNCRLRYAGWREVWVDNCETWQEEEDAVEWQPPARPRDLQRDLELCDAATPGPWMGDGSQIWSGDILIATMWDDFNYADRDFIAQAREGWPEAIHRALAAENRVRQLEEYVRELQREIQDFIDRG